MGKAKSGGEEVTAASTFSAFSKVRRLFRCAGCSYDAGIIRSSNIITMPQVNIPSPFGGRDLNGFPEKNNKRFVRQTDLVKLFLDPLSAQIDRARLELLAKIQEVSDTLDIIARQTRRQIEE